MKCPTSLTVLLLFVAQVRCEYYSAVTRLQDLIDAESMYVESFEDYLANAEQNTIELENTLDRIEKLIEARRNDIEHFQHPLNAFKIIKRFVVDWQDIYDSSLDTEIFSEFTQRIDEVTTEKPTYDDFQGAAKGLALLQNTYALPTADLANGILMDTKYSNSLSPTDCYYMGESHYKQSEYRLAAEWLLEARVRLQWELTANNNTYGFPYIFEEYILQYLAPSLYNIGNVKLAQRLNEELLSFDPDNEYGQKNQEIFKAAELKERRTAAIENPTSEKSLTELQDLYRKVCRGEVKRSASEERSLRCRYVDKGVPFCRIAPFKMEELSHDPFVAVYHEAIYDSEIENILNAAHQDVQRSKVGNQEHSRYSDVRTSQQTWLWWKDHPFLKDIGQRLVDITGLSLETAEALQVANYGIGGHYGPHFDFFENSPNIGDHGNRMLTALFYINHIEQGGSTAFPYLKLAVPPTRRSLLVWYNMHESTELDYRTKHAGCPVLKGSKWICNEWFHEVGQEFRRPCKLQPQGHLSIMYKDGNQPLSDIINK